MEEREERGGGENRERLKKMGRGVGLASGRGGEGEVLGEEGERGEVG